MLVDSGHGTVVKLVIRLPSAELGLARDALRNLTYVRVRLSVAAACQIRPRVKKGEKKKEKRAGITLLQAMLALFSF